jgi:hypothetical protein
VERPAIGWLKFSRNAEGVRERSRTPSALRLNKRKIPDKTTGQNEDY